MNLKSKVLVLSFVAILWTAKAEKNNIAWPLHEATPTTNGCIAKSLDHTGGGSIVVINDDGINYLVVSSNDESLIGSVKIYDSSGKNVDAFSGCGSYNCSYNISGLGKGIYTVSVATATGSFGGYITI
jgi:hypothetical protein